MDHARVRRLDPSIYGFRGLFIRLRSRVKHRIVMDRRRDIEDQLLHGDCRAAVVALVEPLLVAAYTDELDCVVMLSFPQWIAREHGLCEGRRLLTVNAYYDWRHGLAQDLEPGPASHRRWTNFGPIIADFVAQNAQAVAARKERIPEREWQRAEELAADHLARHGHRARNGSPAWSLLPAR